MVFAERLCHNPDGTQPTVPNPYQRDAALRLAQTKIERFKDDNRSEVLPPHHLIAALKKSLLDVFTYKDTKDTFLYQYVQIRYHALLTEVVGKLPARIIQSIVEQAQAEHAATHPFLHPLQTPLLESLGFAASFDMSKHPESVMLRLLTLRSVAQHLGINAPRLATLTEIMASAFTHEHPQAEDLPHRAEHAARCAIEQTKIFPEEDLDSSAEKFHKRMQLLYSITCTEKTLREYQL